MGLASRERLSAQIPAIQATKDTEFSGADMEPKANGSAEELAHKALNRAHEDAVHYDNRAQAYRGSERFEHLFDGPDPKTDRLLSSAYWDFSATLAPALAELEIRVYRATYGLDGKYTDKDVAEIMAKDKQNSRAGLEPKANGSAEELAHKALERALKDAAHYEDRAQEYRGNGKFGHLFDGPDTKTDRLLSSAYWDFSEAITPALTKLEIKVYRATYDLDGKYTDEDVVKMMTKDQQDNGKIAAAV